MSTETVTTNLVIDAGNVFISIGSTELSLPLPHIDTALRLLEAARLIAGTNTGVSMNVGPARAASQPLPVVASDGVTPNDARKRRSRKRVGDALIQWMRQNSGWHTEQALLDAVVEHEMTDAHPKRALKIALGKQRGEVFDGDGHGHWKLIDDDAGPAPRVRASKSAAKGTSKAAGAGRGATPRGGEAGGKLGEAAKAVNRSKRRVRLKTKPRHGESAPPVEPEKGARIVRVKKGQDRKLAALPPGEREARAEGGAGSSAARKKRWQQISNDELERARRNLLGLGS